MTPEELDEARAKEAQRLWESGQEAGSSSWVVAARLAREGWTPPKPVDPDLLAFREWSAAQGLDPGPDVLLRDTYLAGARMAREQERERAKVLDQAKAIIDQHARLLARLPLGLRAQIGIEWQTMMDATASFYAILAKYRGEA